MQVRRAAEDFAEPSLQRPRLEERLGGSFPFVAPPSPQRLSAPFWAGQASQLAASVDEEPFDIEGYYEEHHEGFLAEEAGDKMRGVTDEMILAGKNKEIEKMLTASTTARRLLNQFVHAMW